MIFRRIIYILLLAITLKDNAICQNIFEGKNNIEIRIEKLLAQMTLEEKVGQLVQYSSQWEMTGPVPATSTDFYERIKTGGVGAMLNVIGANAVRKAQELAVNNSRLGIPLIFGYDVIQWI